jgi:hypothetical protein
MKRFSVSTHYYNESPIVPQAQKPGGSHMPVNEGKTNHCPNGTELVGDADDKDGSFTNTYVLKVDVRDNAHTGAGVPVGGLRAIAGLDAVGIVGVGGGGPADDHKNPFNLADNSFNAAGIYGAGGPDGTGVFGQGGSRTKDIFDSAIGVIGVGGATEGDFPSGAGVLGSGSIGVGGIGTITGVNGTSTVGRGGVFGSGVEVPESPVLTGTFTEGGIAPLQIVPAVFESRQVMLPKTGRIGDLFVTAEVSSFPGSNPTAIVNMYLCVLPDGSANAAQWAPFQLGTPIAGGTNPGT